MFMCMHACHIFRGQKKAWIPRTGVTLSILEALIALSQTCINLTL